MHGRSFISLLNSLSSEIQLCPRVVYIFITCRRFLPCAVFSAPELKIIREDRVLTVENMVYAIHVLKIVLAIVLSFRFPICFSFRIQYWIYSTEIQVLTKIHGV